MPRQKQNKEGSTTKSKEFAKLMERVKKLESENAKLVSEKVKLTQKPVASSEQNAIIEGLLAKIKELESKKAEVESKYNYVGVRNTLKGVCWIKVIGGALDGSEDIKLNGGEAKPVPALTWEYMVNNRHPNIVEGVLIRDDSILGTFGYKADVTELGEKDRFPNSVSDQDIRDWYAMALSGFKKHINAIDSDVVMERIVEIGKKMEDKDTFKHLKAAESRLMDMKNPIPDNFDEMNEDELFDFAATYNIPVDPKKHSRDVTKLREFIKESIEAHLPK